MNKYLIINLLVVALMFAMTFTSEAKNPKGASNNPHYVISVTQGDQKLGDILIEIYADVAPKHAHNFDSLVAAKFYDGTAFHRVIPGFMIQGGDPNSKNGPVNTWGYGDPSQTKVPAEFSQTLQHKRGILSAARSQDPNSASSQFFICVADCPSLDKQYSIFGKVLSGMDVADKIVNSPRDARDNPNTKIEMKIVKKTDK
jgi:cyclophilin family peptidyl-prolyl cis-trans isomerase